MKKIGYSERQPVSILLEKHLKEKGMRAFTYVSSDMPQLDVDVIVEESKNFEKFKKHESLVEIWDMRLQAEKKMLSMLKLFLNSKNYEAFHYRY